MRLVKMFGLAALAAVAAMAFLGASSASANQNTALCKTHTALTCSSFYGEKDTIHLLNTEVAKLLSDLVDVLCLTVLANVKSLGLATAPAGLLVHGKFTYAGCGTTANHNNCTVTEEAEALFDLLKTGLNEGTGTGLAGQAHVVCKNIFGFIEIDCKYNASGLAPEFLSNSHARITEQEVELTDGTGFCPDESFVDGLLKPLTNVAGETPAYVLQ